MQKTAILALAFSVLVQAQNRCGVSWEAANAACGASCVYPDAPCPAGQKCFADLNQAVCSGVVRTTAAAAATTDAAASAAGASATASALSPTDAVAVINQLPSCAVSCLANGSGSTVTLQTAQQLCASVASGTFNITQATTCLGTSCSKEQADASISFLTTNAGQLLNACKAIPAPTGASATAKASGTAAAAATTTTVAKVAEVKETERVPWANAVFIIALTAVLLAFSFCICCLLLCCHRKRNDDKKEANEAAPVAAAPVTSDPTRGEPTRGEIVEVHSDGVQKPVAAAYN